jgi:vitamin B12 transporter
MRITPFFLAAVVAIPSAHGEAEPIEQLERVEVFAGQFPTGEQPGAVLDALDVVRTPGAAADINRALQTLPGIQLPDEGNALFVRGGDSTETAMLINGLRYPSSTQLNSPAGHFTGTLNPFEARRITFASGGFGARFGNALSGIVDVETSGAPGINSVTLGAGLGAISAGANITTSETSGVRFTATRSSVAPINGLNGSNRDYPEPPNGHDFSGGGAWEYRRGGELRVFAVEQDFHLGLNVRLPTQQGLFRQRVANRLGTLSWSDSFGAWSFHVDAGGGTLKRSEVVGTVSLATLKEHRQLGGRASYDVNGRVQVSLGGEITREETTLGKIIPPDGFFPGGTFTTRVPGTLSGAFVEADTTLLPHLRAIVGARTDTSSLTRTTTVDPRVSFAWEPHRALTFSLGGGTYHQIPDAYAFVTDFGRTTLPPMRANQLLAAVQLGKAGRLARVEVYTKDYADLVSPNREYRPVPGGHGRADGLDIFLKSPLPFAVIGRLTYSYVDTRRTDADTGRMAPAPFDVNHTASLLLERAFGGWMVGGAWRYASGRPTTPITSGTPDGRGGFSPVYGGAFSERLPALARIDLNASRYYRLNTHTGLVLYAAVNNVLNRRNVYTYEYSDDFSTRRPTPSLFKRGFYFGFSITFN